MMRWFESDAKRAGAQSVTVNVSTQENLLADLKQRFQNKTGFCIATLNLDHVAKLRSSPEFAEAYLNHTHVTADGNPIVWLSRLAGQHVNLLPGSDLILPVAALAVETGVPVAFLGSTDAALTKAAEALKAQFPKIEITTRIAPPMGFDPQGAQADAYIETLRRSGAALCFVALGAPKQEIFATRASRALPQMGFLSIGAGLDFLSGDQQRAPQVVRFFAMEWLWRLALNPRRLARRYGACIAILPRLFGHALSTRLRRAPSKT